MNIENKANKLIGQLCKNTWEEKIIWNKGNPVAQSILLSTTAKIIDVELNETFYTSYKGCEISIGTINKNNPITSTPTYNMEYIFVVNNTIIKFYNKDLLGQLFVIVTRITKDIRFIKNDKNVNLIEQNRYINTLFGI